MKARAFGHPSSALAFLILLAQFQPLVGQSLWSQPCSQKTIGLEIAKPFFDGGNDHWSALSSASFLSASLPWSENASLVVELPLAYGSFDPKYEGLSSESKLTVGNPYVGVIFQTSHQGLSGQVGLRLPLAPADGYPASTIGLFSDYINRSEAFLDGLVPFGGVLTLRRVSDNGLLLGVTGGGNVWIPTGEHGETEVFGIYGGQGGYYGPDWSVTAGFAGRVLVTEDGLDLSERTFHEVRFDLGYHGTRIQPTLFVRAPVDKPLGDFVKTVVGLGFRTGF